MPEATAAEAGYLKMAAEFSFRARMDKSSAQGPVFQSASGSVVRDVNGKEYLDFNSGQMCSALGHNHPKIAAAIKEAADTMIHAHSSHYNVKEVELAAAIGSVVPRPLQKSLFGESGADANEMAMMIARKYTGGHEIASPHISFHGLSDATRAVTFSGWHANHGPLPTGTYALVAPYCYRCPLAQTYPACEFACLKTSFELLDAQSTGRPAAVITEPLFSAGGVIEPPIGWLKRLQEMCHARGMLLICDEEQTGLGKLGAMFGFERDGIVPDIVTIAKHFGGGVGVSAVVTSAKIEEKVVEAGYAATHSHSNDPLICAAGTASIGIVVDENVPARAAHIGARVIERLKDLQQRFEGIGDIRGRGMLVGIEIVTDRQSKKPDGATGNGVARACFDKGLIFSVRRNGSVLRFVPPQTTTDAQIDDAMEILETSFADVLKAKRVN
ncbi:MAG: aminotransferase class III-fold pyridoxal phosphate-dependent enzyme [Rhodospirillales bacterium]|nr:aminotransferase class III-fold pyridoxal phosphate-dependent enzyme [Rhodospirillales bacterium]